MAITVRFRSPSNPHLATARARVAHWLVAVPALVPVVEDGEFYICARESEQRVQMRLSEWYWYSGACIISMPRDSRPGRGKFEPFTVYDIIPHKKKKRCVYTAVYANRNMHTQLVGTIGAAPPRTREGRLKARPLVFEKVRDALVVSADRRYSRPTSCFLDALRAITHAMGRDAVTGMNMIGLSTATLDRRVPSYHTYCIIHTIFSCSGWGNFRGASDPRD